MSETATAMPAAVVRELYDALMDARPCVYNRLCEERAASQPAKAETLERILDRVDVALADAGEYLAGESAT